MGKCSFTRLAALGFAVAVLIVAYFELRLPGAGSAAAGIVMLFLCPAYIISVVFIDFGPSSTQAFVVWFAIAVLNGAIYAAIGDFVKKFRGRSIVTAKS